MSKLKQFFDKTTLLIIGLTIGIFLLTKNSITAPLRLHFTLFSIIVFLIYSYKAKKHNLSANSKKYFPFLIITTVLFLVGATGWFFSPFFFLLYLSGIFLIFNLSSSASVAFIITLVGLFSLNIGEVDLSYDVMVVLSLLTAIPLSFYIKKKYQKVADNEKNGESTDTPRILRLSRSDPSD